MPNGNWHAYLAEFVGTLGFVLFGAGSVVALDAGSDLGMTGVALAHGFGIAAFIYATQRLSGGHLNPAVTVGFWLSKKIQSGQAVGYVVSQLLGGVVAAYLVKTFFPVASLVSKVGAPALSPGVSVSLGIGIEAVLTFLLVWAVFSLGSAEGGLREHLGLAVGAIVAASVLVAGHATGAALNPARAFGPAFVAEAWANHSVWWVGPFVGAAAAALVQRLLSQRS